MAFWQSRCEIKRECTPLLQCKVLWKHFTKLPWSQKYKLDVSNYRDIKRKETEGSSLETGAKKDDASKVSNQGVLRCYECNETGHLAEECLFKMGKNGKIAKSKKSSVKKQIKLVQDDTESESSLTEDYWEDKCRSEEEEVGFVDVNSEVKDEFQRMT